MGLLTVEERDEVARKLERGVRSIGSGSRRHRPGRMPDRDENESDAFWAMFRSLLRCESGRDPEAFVVRSVFLRMKTIPGVRGSSGGRRFARDEPAVASNYRLNMPKAASPQSEDWAGPARGPSPEDQAESSEFVAIVAEEVAALGGRKAEIASAILIYGEAAIDVARRLGVSKFTVNTHMHYARKRLQERLRSRLGPLLAEYGVD